jgi:hypothetical protein
MIFVQTFSAIGFGIFFILLSFVVHPRNATIGLPLLVIGGVLILVGIFGGIVIARRGARR